MSPPISRATRTGKRKTLITSAALLLLAPAGLSQQPASQEPNARIVYLAAVEACKAKDYSSCVEKMRKAVDLIPDYPRLIYGLGAANALAGNKAEAVGCLARLAAMGLVFDPARDPSFASIKDTSEFAAVNASFRANTAPVLQSSTAFIVPEKGLIPEGLAYDPVEEVFYLGSVHKRKIVAVDKRGQTKTLASEADGLWSVLGMAVDIKRRRLWVTTTAFPQMAHFRAEQDGMSAVLKFDLTTRKLIKKYPLDNSTVKHALGDLTINSNGDVFTTDSLSPAVYKIDHEKDNIELFLESDSFASPQGLVFSPDEKHLFMADYARGVFDIDVAAKRPARIGPLPNATMLGIDGLYFFRGSLIGVQNGVAPNRVVRIYLSTDLRRAERFEVIEANNPLFDEPSLGAVVKDAFYFIADSQWRLADDKGQLGPEAEFRDPVILKIKLAGGN